MCPSARVHLWFQIQLNKVLLSVWSWSVMHLSRLQLAGWPVTCPRDSPSVSRIFAGKFILCLSLYTLSALAAGIAFALFRNYVRNYDFECVFCVVLNVGMNMTTDVGIYMTTNVRPKFSKIPVFSTFHVFPGLLGTPEISQISFFSNFMFF